MQCEDTIDSFDLCGILLVAWMFTCCSHTADIFGNVSNHTVNVVEFELKNINRIRTIYTTFVSFFVQFHYSVHCFSFIFFSIFTVLCPKCISNCCQMVSFSTCDTLTWLVAIFSEQMNGISLKRSSQIVSDIVVRFFLSHSLSFDSIALCAQTATFLLKSNLIWPSTFKWFQFPFLSIELNFSFSRYCSSRKREKVQNVVAWLKRCEKRTFKWLWKFIVLSWIWLSNL